MAGEIASPVPTERESETTQGNYFVSNYPPFSFWKPEHTHEVSQALGTSPSPDIPLGIYLHIPFCRKRCHFCYFKVYTDMRESEIQHYLDAVLAELRLYSQKPFIAGRKPDFVYFGGGTPSYLSSRQLSRLTDEMKTLLPWDQAREVTFECEPGTLTEAKLKVIKDLGVTRLSLGIENFDEGILKTNGRAHGAREIDRAYAFARSLGFPQVNIDLIAGMVGETTENWQDCVRRTIALEPDSVTIYQMEIPYNTTISKEMRAHGETIAPVASWQTKRDWVAYAFARFEEAGYTVTSAYTAVKNSTLSRFVYRDQLWHGADLLGLGVASFSYLAGIHFQNEHEFNSYLGRLQKGELPIYRALRPTEEERLIREFILQMKLGHVEPSYFQKKFGVDIRQRFAIPLSSLQDQKVLLQTPQGIELNRAGLLQVDRLLAGFFLPQHRNVRYT
ncbi:MAG: coproporphyrinogen-III oxidase family protein [Terriglobia bacterium]